MKITDGTRQALECFARNGRWGTCVECPRTATGYVFPEFCPQTVRYDHHLGLNELVQQIERTQR